MGRKISKTKHDWESFILLYEWEQFLIYNIAVIFRILIFCQFGILLTVKDWHLWFCPLLNIRAVTDYEKVIITIDFCSVESYEEKAEFLRVTCTFSWASDCTLINFVLVFGNKFSCNQGEWGYFWWFYTSFSYFRSWNTESFYRGLAPEICQARPKSHQLRSLQQI